VTETIVRSNAHPQTLVFEVLRRSELFAPLPEQALRQVASRATLRTYRRGEKLWEHGTPSTAFVVVASGRVKCWSPGHEARQWVSAVVRPGGVCGLAPGVDGGTYTCNAEPLERSRVVSVPAPALRAAMEQEPTFSQHVARMLAREVRRVLAACEDVTLRSPLERLAHYLATQANGAGVVELRETQTQIAAQLGTVREVVGRAFRALESRGVISRNGRVVRIQLPRELSELATG
jgi:CRP/FNR family transcriptional regulator